VTESLALLAQASGIAYASGVSLYATIAVTGLATRMGWIEPPGAIGAMGSWWIIGIALVLYIIEFSATLIPGIASAWETVHSLVRPPAAAVLAAATAWQGDPGLVLAAALLGGGVAATTHATKLGLRYAIDTSPEPITNGLANTAELGVVAAIAVFVWNHPWVTLGLAIALLIALVLAVRLIWRVLRQVFSGRWMPACGLLQEARTSDRLAAVEDD
jgi:hypothetical protein